MVLEKGRFKQIHEWYNHQGFDAIGNDDFIHVTTDPPLGYVIELKPLGNLHGVIDVKFFLFRLTNIYA